MTDFIDYDYKIITVDSAFSTFKDSNWEFYFNLDEPLRNVFKINVITMFININNSYVNNTVDANNNKVISTLDPIYINVNNYNRLISYANNSIIKVFDSFLILDQLPTTVNATTTIKNEYVHSDSFFTLNPIDPQLIRFNVKLINKNNLIFSKSDNYINRFVMKLGIYYNNKKTTRI